MDNNTKFQIEQDTDLYKFYITSYLKAIAFYIAINGVLLKFAVDSTQYRSVFCLAALLYSLVLGPVIVFGMFQNRSFRSRFKKYSASSGIESVSTAPGYLFGTISSFFWIATVVGWIYILFVLAKPIY